MMIRARKLHYQVAGRRLVSGADLDLDAGEVLAVLGPNGAGKSTLLKLLCGELKPDSGDIFFEERKIGHWPARELARRRAVMPQQSLVPFDFTALEIVLLGRSPHGDEGSSRELALEAMEWADCTHLASRIVSTLSGGELQRVHLARVLAQAGLGRAAPACLLLDEPVSSLDPFHQHAVLRVARKMAAQGAAVLAILHDLNLAAQYSDRMVLLKEGAIAASGAPFEVLTPPLIREVFSMRAHVLENPVSGAPAVFLE
jgi:iron complex transport system ATP-binding protein